MDMGVANFGKRDLESLCPPIISVTRNPQQELKKFKMTPLHHSSAPNLIYLKTQLDPR
jgi:hypothetical protein